jgi:hypothetical protein
MGVLKQYKTDECVVGIEGYSFGVSDSSSISTMCEVGGLIRWHLWKHGFAFVEIAPNTVKLLFTHFGSADKYMMWLRFLELQIIHDLPLVLKFKKCSSDTKFVMSSTKVPNPIQDIVDSFAIVKNPGA